MEKPQVKNGGVALGVQEDNRVIGLPDGLADVALRALDLLGDLPELQIAQPPPVSFDIEYLPSEQLPGRVAQPGWRIRCGEEEGALERPGRIARVCKYVLDDRHRLVTLALRKGLVRTQHNKNEDRCVRYRARRLGKEAALDRTSG